MNSNAQILKVIDNILKAQTHQLTMADIGYRAAIRDVLSICSLDVKQTKEKKCSR